jgi:hypothetical protein
MKYLSNKNQAGVVHLLIPVIIVVVGVIGFAVYNFMQNAPAKQTDSGHKSAQPTPKLAAAWPTATTPTWTADGRGGWISMPYDTKPPACPDPIELASPTPQLSKATSILYPGQSRTGTFAGLGGTYKPHGAFRFDKSANDDVSVVMPFNGYVFRGSRMIESGELQYDFDILNACGVMIRVGHLRTLSPAFQAIADKFPPAVAGDSRTTNVTPVVPFKKGDVIATSVGFKNATPVNVTFDFGVYDLRTNNEAAKSSKYQSDHAGSGELAYHGLCWLDLLEGSSKAAAKALPAGDMTNGKQSDYCK